MSKLIYEVTYNQVSPSYFEAYREVFTQPEYQPPVKYKNNSRYSNLRTLIDPETGKLYHENWIQKIVDYSSEDQYFTVTKVEENRLDLVANRFYYTGKYWWVVAIANYILDPFDIPVGMNLRIPPITSLYNEGGILRG